MDTKIYFPILSYQRFIIIGHWYGWAMGYPTLVWWIASNKMASTCARRLWSKYVFGERRRQRIRALAVKSIISATLFTGAHVDSMWTNRIRQSNRRMDGRETHVRPMWKSGHWALSTGGERGKWWTECTKDDAFSLLIFLDVVFSNVPLWNKSNKSQQQMH